MKKDNFWKVEMICFLPNENFFFPWNAVLYPRNDTDRLYVSIKERETGFSNIEDCLDVTIQGFKEYIFKKREKNDWIQQKQNQE